MCMLMSGVDLTGNSGLPLAKLPLSRVRSLTYRRRALALLPVIKSGVRPLRSPTF